MALCLGLCGVTESKQVSERSMAGLVHLVQWLALVLNLEHSMWEIVGLAGTKAL